MGRIIFVMFATMAALFVAIYIASLIITNNYIKDISWEQYQEINRLKADLKECKEEKL